MRIVSSSEGDATGAPNERGQSRPRVLFFGTRGPFSGPPLAALLDAEIPVVGVVLPSRPGRPGEAAPALRELPKAEAPHGLPMLAGEPTLPDLARAHDLPLFELSRPADPAAHATLAALQPEVIAVACFPRILPPALLALPRLGGLNLHPSLLPRHRGPAPLFWTFYHGDRVAGVTIHIMNDRVDSGDILHQAAVAIPDGTTGPELERACAVAGGDLLVAAVRGHADGTLTPRPQHEAEATYAPWPTPRDLEIPSWTAERARRFVRGVSEWYPVVEPGKLSAFFRNSPLRSGEIDLTRDTSPLREKE